MLITRIELFEQHLSLLHDKSAADVGWLVDLEYIVLEESRHITFNLFEGLRY